MHIRKFNSNDIDRYIKWLKQDYIIKWYKNPEEWVHEVMSEDFSWVNHFIVEYDNQPIGFCQCYEYVKGKETWHGKIPLEGTYSIDYLIGEPQFLRKGIGKENHASCNTLLAADYVYDEENELYIVTKHDFQNKNE